MPIILPEPTPLNIFLYLAFTALAAGMGPFDYFGAMPMRYSKFRGEKGIASRAGMFFLYFVPLLAALGFCLPYLTHLSLVQAILLLALLLHYAKRCLEVLFLHKYSGPMDVLTTLSIAGFYTLVAAGISALNASSAGAPRRAVLAWDAFLCGWRVPLTFGITNSWPICVKIQAVTLSRAAAGSSGWPARIISSNCWPGWGWR